MTLELQYHKLVYIDEVYFILSHGADVVCEQFCNAFDC